MSCKCGNALKDLAEYKSGMCSLCTIYACGLQHCWLDSEAERKEIRDHGIKIGAELPDYSESADDAFWQQFR